MKNKWYQLVLFSVLFTFVFTTCEDKKDTTPPEVTITSPSNDSKVNEVVTVTCMSTDNKEVTKVELWVDGVNTGLTDETEPYSFQWNTTKYNDGDHTLIVRGYDTSDNEGDSPPINVKVDNTVSVPKSISVQSVDFSSGGFTIKWSKSTDGDFKSYSVEHSIESGMEDYEEVFVTEDLNVTNSRMENVSPLVFHYFRVTVTDTFDYQTKGSIYSSSLDPIPDSVDVKSVIYDLEKMTVEWSESNVGDFGSYKLLYSKTESGDKDTLETYTDKSITSYSTSTYDPLIENWYWVMITDTLGQSKIGVGKTNTIDSPPTQPILNDIVYDHVNSVFKLSWEQNTDYDYKSLTLYESLSEDMGESREIYKTNVITDTTFVVTMIVEDEYKYYQIIVEDIWGLIEKSLIVNGSSFQKIVFSKIVFNPDERGEIYSIDINGLSEKRLTNNNVHDLYQKYTPDGTKIVFYSSRDGSEEIYIMDFDGSNQTRLTTEGGFSFQISPDGTKIVFNSNRDGSQEIYIMDINGSNQTRLTFNNKDCYDAKFSRDGNKIVYIVDNINDFDIFLMNIDGSSQVELSNNEYRDINPQFSFNGNKIVFQSTRDGNYEIYSMDIDGNNQTNLTNSSSPEDNLTVSPTDSFIIYRTNGDLWKMRTDGSNQEYLTNSGHSPVFSHTGLKILITKSISGYNQIFIIDTDGKNEKRITNNSSHNEFPSLQPRQ